ncbi:putative acetyltransferase [Camellia lanceoleosa]|uniref:Acetyltransferase n=1 Tax=Camellia lanceoleosa TaxID=1840588 RepID=A0ACC0IFK8_9ERIC|nr:putative acetyltransferase [Camellia lanceoleosa]
MNPPNVQYISQCFIKPKSSLQEEEAKQPIIHLAPWDITKLSTHYIQKGLLFVRPSSMIDQENSIQTLLERLKESLSLTLVHFYPLAGRLATTKQENPPHYCVYINNSNSPGAKFIHAAVNLTLSDILSPVDVPLVVQSFFDHDRAINHDGHTLSLLSIQVTELVDGIFIGCSINHAVVDGTSYWHFFNTWSDIFMTNNSSISRPPLLNRYSPVLNLPFTHHDQFISRYKAPPLRERIFHLSSESIAKLKAKANAEWQTNSISSLQSVSAFIWRCITRTRCLPYDQKTSCIMSINDRTRIEPPLPEGYCGNFAQTVRGIAKAGELLEKGLGWAAWQLREAVANHNDKAVREWVEKWMKTPLITRTAEFFDPCGILVSSSPRFKMYENEFGMGRAVAIRSGYANKLDGKVMMYPGYEGGGSMDLEVCLLPESMRDLESDGEFMDAVCMSV